MSASGVGHRKTVYEPAAIGFLHTYPPYCYRCPYEKRYPECEVFCARTIRTMIEWEDPRSVAAIIVEPITNTGGIITPPMEYLKILRQLCDEFNKEMDLDNLLPNITRNMLIAGYCPVETEMNKIPSKCAIKIIHPTTIGGNGMGFGKESGLIIDNNTGEFVALTQKNGTRINADQIALFVNCQLGNYIRGVSHIQPVYTLLNYKQSALENMDKILARYASPKGIWKSTKDISALRRQVVESEAGEDLFLGKLSPEELDKIVEFLEVNPQARFWEYVQYIDQCIYEGLRGPDRKSTRLNSSHTT
jgi:hypothetical protein